MNPYVKIDEEISPRVAAILASARRIQGAVSGSFTTEASMVLAKENLAKIKAEVRALEELL